MHKIANALYLRSDGTFKQVQPKNGTDFSLEELQEMVDGHIQIVGCKEEEKILVINEEGKVLDLPYNKRASSLYRYGEHDVILGDALYCEASLVR